MYVDFDYYSESYGGSLISSADFGYYERKAESYINAVTFGRVSADSLTDDIKDAVCDVSEMFFRAGKNPSANGITSEKIGDYSVSYGGVTSGNPEFKSLLYAAVKLRLGNTGLLYRGDNNCLQTIL